MLNTTQNGMAAKYKKQMTKYQTDVKKTQNNSVNAENTVPPGRKQYSYHEDMTEDELNESIMAIRYNTMAGKKKHGIIHYLFNIIFYMFAFASIAVGILFILIQFNPSLMDYFANAVNDTLQYINSIPK